MMEIVAWIILAFAALQFVVAFVNAVLQPKLNQKPTSNDLVSVLIPARNEEQNIVNLLIDLQHQTYKNIEIFVFDDLSTDRTAELVGEMAKYDSRIKLLSSTGLPENWLGKNYACNELAKQASGKYFIFLDADVRTEQNLIAFTISYLQKQNIQLLSIFPMQMMHGLGEKMVVPIMNYILQTLLPLVLVLRSKYASLAAANGQFMLFEAATYRKLQPHELLKGEKVEDIKTAQLYKKHGYKMACLSNNADVSCRMYTNYTDCIEGFSKNIVMFFGNSYLLTFVFWLVTTVGFVAVLLALPMKYFWLLAIITIVTRVFVSIGSNQKSIQNLMFLVPQQINIGIILFKSIINKKNKQYSWKGRIIE